MYHARVEGEQARRVGEALAREQLALVLEVRGRSVETGRVPASVLEVGAEPDRTAATRSAPQHTTFLKPSSRKR